MTLEPVLPGRHAGSVALDGSETRNFWVLTCENSLPRSNIFPSDLLADAMKDCSRRGAIVLDPFGGCGTTLIAAQKSGRVARLIEYDPAYCDVILRRFEAATGTSATLASTGQTFEDVAEARTGRETSHDPDQ